MGRLSASDYAAWAQALAGIVALYIAVQAIRVPQIAKKKEDKLRAISLALLIYPSFMFLRKQTGAMKRNLDHDLRRGDEFMYDTPSWARICPTFKLDIPSILLENKKEIWMMGDNAGKEATQALALVHFWNDLVDQMAKTTGHTEQAAALKAALPSLEAARLALGEAEKAVGLLHDASD